MFTVFNILPTLGAASQYRAYPTSNACVMMGKRFTPMINRINTMELDHIFVFVEPGGGAARRKLAKLGLTETYSRVHPGQGTENVCYAFDNAFLELLWLRDLTEAESAPVIRTGLAPRSQWKQQQTSPFGIAWRLDPGEDQPVETWPYCPPYLPEGLSIPVAMSSDDVQQPFLFMSPGKQAPQDWPEERRGSLQSQAGFTSLHTVTLYSEVNAPINRDLKALATAGLLNVNAVNTTNVKILPRLDIALRRTSGELVWLSLPSFKVLDM